MTCPGCGTELPLTVVASCPHCGHRLGNSPSPDISIPSSQSADEHHAQDTGPRPRGKTESTDKGSEGGNLPLPVAIGFPLSVIALVWLASMGCCVGSVSGLYDRIFPPPTKDYSKEFQDPSYK